MTDTRAFVPVGAWLDRRAELSPERIGLVDFATGDRFTYRALALRARTVAAWLHATHGVGKGDRVAMLAHNAPEYLDAFFACALLGAIFVPLNWRLTPPELRTILTDCAPRVLLHDGAQADAAQAVMALLGETPPAVPEKRGLLGSRRKLLATATLPALVAIASLPGADGTLAAQVEPFATADGEEIALILYTSGTTGVPKGAMLSHRMLTWNAINTQISWGLRDDDSTPTFAPFFHAGGLNVLTTPLYHLGGTVVLLRAGDPATVLQAIQQERCTILFAVPTVFQTIMEHPAFATTDLTSLRFCVAGGSACPLPLIQGYAARQLEFRQGYGLTEAGVNCFSLAPADALRKAGSVGKPIFHSRARVVDEDDHDVAPGAIGELVLAGPHICSGYWQRPEATAAATRGGWWHTGDLVRRDDEGYYFIVGRKKDLYISGGENVYPIEIENLLATHPGIAAAAVIAQPDPRWGEVGLAVVVPRQPGALTEAEVLAFCDGKLARYKIPKRVVFAASLPLNAMGKVIKADLRARYVSG
jgi:fatty-acyl-CoA synthase